MTNWLLDRFIVSSNSKELESLPSAAVGDDEAEASQYAQKSGTAPDNRKSRSRGQNTNRTFGYSRDLNELCSSRATSSEFSPGECRFGDDCTFEHDLRKYLKEGKRADLSTFDGICPVWAARGTCPSGWKCRFLASHMRERETADGRKELVLIEDEERISRAGSIGKKQNADIVHVLNTDQKNALTRRKVPTKKADTYLKWLDSVAGEAARQASEHNLGAEPNDMEQTASRAEELPDQDKQDLEDNRAQYKATALLPSEKRSLYFGPDTPVLAPLTTQGNLPFRRLCVDLGAQVTYSEMAMSLPLIQGKASEWALLKAHASEATPPLVKPNSPIINAYDNAKDIKFGAQIAAGKPWQAVKATEILTTHCDHLREINLNCGCPIDMIYRAGAGSALLDNQSRLEKMVRGMNYVSGEVPITVKIRMGAKDGKPTALKLVQRLMHGRDEGNDYMSSPSGVAAITLHGRSRQQRYTKSADWEYISECAALVKQIQSEQDAVADTIREVDPRTQPAATGGKVYFLGNGDCYSHEDYYSHLDNARVDAVMLGRGPLIKPWIFEEIHQGQHLDKSAGERLAYIEQYVKYGLQTWGSDEMGIGTTRRFLLEWLSFSHRYVPLGLLERLPPNIQERPPRWRGRNELETLLGSDNFRDWIKIRYACNKVTLCFR